MLQSATTAEGLVLVCKNNLFVKPSCLESEKKSELKKEIERYPDIALKSIFSKLTEKNYFQVISHNVQSLNAHLGQIINDQVYISSDIILLNETWTLPSDNFDIPGFDMVSSQWIVLDQDASLSVLAVTLHNLFQDNALFLRNYLPIKRTIQQLALLLSL